MKIKLFNLLLFGAFHLFCFQSLYAQEQNYDTSNLVVRLNFKLLDWNIIDDVSLFEAPISRLLNKQGKQELEKIETSGFSFKDLTAHKIFPMLQTEDSISISRHGEQVYIPPFWATFLVDIPENIQYAQFLSELKTLYPLVIYTHPNYYVEFQSVPDDTLYNLQSSLFNNGSGAAHINIEGAWDITTGKDFIKVGVFDTGIDTTHEDLEVLVGAAGHLSPIQIGNSLYLEWGVDNNGHGTKSAGIIGAKRNNLTGIAGIAGGDDSDSTGVHLLDFKMDDTYNDGTFSNIANFSALIMDAARSPGSYYDWEEALGIDIDDFIHYYQNAPGFGIHIANHSNAYRLGNPYKNDDLPNGGVSYPYYDKCDLCLEAFLFSLKNGVISVTATGNKGNEPGVFPQNFDGSNIYPASFHDSWSIRVGASEMGGDVLMGGINYPSGQWFSVWNENVDLIAPGQRHIIRTTHAVDTARYGNYNGSSAAAPHVSGVAALLLSHYNKPCYSNLNLDMADVEYILEKSATATTENISAGFHHPGAGWGRLNATEALKMIDFPEYQIIHPNDTFIEKETISIDTIIVYYKRPLVSSAKGPISSSWPLKIERPYEVVRHEVQLTYDFSQYIQDSTQLLDAWVRHSQTNSLDRFVDTTMNYDTILGSPQLNIEVDAFRVEPMASIDTINDSVIKMTGYYYHFIKQFDDEIVNNIPFADQYPENYWYPINPNTELPQMGYSIYIRDSTLTERYDFDCDAENMLVDTLAQLNELINHEFLVYPNPATNELYIDIKGPKSESGKIQLLDISGRLIDEKPLKHHLSYRFDIQNLNKGIYFVHLTDGKGHELTKKWIKL